MNQQYSILVVWLDGESEYLKEGSHTAIFSSRKRAESQRDFMLLGMEEDIQSINIVIAVPEDVRAST